MKKFATVLALLVVGIAIGVFITIAGYPTLREYFLLPQAGDTGAVAPAEKKPLYWVAPMDPNYRRDKPGKSPMGMDLIPFYGDEGADSAAAPGAVKISPDVVNNLGVRTAKAHLGSLRSEINTVGYVRYDEDHMVHIHPRVSGWIEKLYIKASGDPVKKGEPLYDLYSPELVNAQEELVIAVDRRKPRLIRAAENRLASLRVPAATIRQIKMSGEAKQTVVFYSPQDGVIDKLDIRQGFYVQPGSTIMSIAALDPIWVEAEVFERQAGGVAVGLSVTMTLDYLPGKVWHGVVDYVYPELNTKTRTLRIRLKFDNKEGLLKPDMFAQVVIHLSNSKESLLVPREAVIRSGRSNRLVLALGDGSFKAVNVEVGRFDEESAEILSGLSAGEKVVTSAQFLIDSESSKTADFERMNHEEKTLPTSVWVEATINGLMADHRMVNVSHKPVPAWDWPEMTMDFSVANDVDFSSLKTGMTVRVEITKLDDNKYQVTKVHVPGAADNANDLKNQSIDDLKMDDLKMDDMNPENTTSDKKESRRP